MSRRTKSLRAATVALVVPLAFLAPAVPATAAGAGSGARDAAEQRESVTIVAPRRVEVGWRGPIRLRGSSFFGDDDHAYLDATGPDGYESYDARWVSDGVFEDPWFVDRFPRPGTYRLFTYFEYDTIRDRHVIEVVHPAPAFEVASLNRTAFHPRVRDGFQDGATVRWRTNRGLTVSPSVIDADGRSVKTWPDATSARGRVLTRTWDGRGDDGRTVPVGRYRVRLVARDNSRNAARVNLPVRVRPGR